MRHLRKEMARLRGERGVTLAGDRVERQRVRQGFAKGTPEPLHKLVERLDRERAGAGMAGSAEILRALSRHIDVAAALKLALHGTPIVGPWELADRDVTDGRPRVYCRKDITGTAVAVVSEVRNGNVSRWRWELRVPVTSDDGNSATSFHFTPPDREELLETAEKAIGEADMRLLEVAPRTMYLDPEDRPGHLPEGCR